MHTEICCLQDQGFNIWFDEGIAPGDEWTETLASAIIGSDTFLYYITPNSVMSGHCRRELSFATESNSRVVAIYLEPTELPGGLRLSLGNRQALDRSTLSEPDYRKKLGAVLTAGHSGVMDSAPPVAPAGVIPRSDARRGIVVVPFQNLSGNEDADYINVGLAEDIMTALSSVESLRVISRGSAMQVDAEALDLGALRRQLNVQYVVHGSVQKSGERLRITVQVPNTETHEILWADKWNSTVDQLFDIQETIARGVVDALQIKLSSRQDARLAGRPIPNMQAYEYYLRARHLIYRYTGEALNKALDYLRLGAEILGDNAHITAATGSVYWQFHNAGIDSDPKHLQEAHKCADKLLAQDPDSPDGHRLTGLLNTHEKGSIQKSVRHLRLALKANPNDTDTLLWLAILYGLVGRISSGHAMAERLLGLDPLTPLPQILPGFLHLMDGDLVRGRTCLLKGHELNPGNPITTLAYGQALAMNAWSEEAESVFASLEEFVPDSFFSHLGEFFIHALRRDKDAALSSVTDVLKVEAGSDLQYSWSMAQCFALIDERDNAMQWLENAVQYGFWNYPLLSERDPLLAPIRDHERFSALMKKVKKKWIDFEV